MFGREPAVIIGVVNAAIALAVGFGLNVSPEQVGLVNAFVAAVLAFVTRSQVTPIATDERGQSPLNLLVWVLVILILVFVLLRLVDGGV